MKDRDINQYLASYPVTPDGRSEKDEKRYLKAPLQRKLSAGTPHIPWEILILISVDIMYVQCFCI